MPIGWVDILIILVFLFLVFGRKKLPEMSRSMVKGVSEFKKSLTGGGKEKEAQAPLQSSVREEH
jgi:TatA/E family protein of Tat protein translocase